MLHFTSQASLLWVFRGGDAIPCWLPRPRPGGFALYFAMMKWAALGAAAVARSERVWEWAWAVEWTGVKCILTCIDRMCVCVCFYLDASTRSPVVSFYPLLGVGFPYSNRLQKRKGILVLTSLLEDLEELGGGWEGFFRGFEGGGCFWGRFCFWFWRRFLTTTRTTLVLASCYFEAEMPKCTSVRAALEPQSKPG